MNSNNQKTRITTIIKIISMIIVILFLGVLGIFSPALGGILAAFIIPAILKYKSKKDKKEDTYQLD